MNKGHLTKLCLLLRLIKKLMQEKKVKAGIQRKKKNCFSNLAENSKFTFYCQKQFFYGCTSIITHFLCNFNMEWWFIKLHSYIMSNKAEPFTLIQMFPLLQLAPVTFCPTLPCSVIQPIFRYI